MSATELIDTVTGLGIELWFEGERLRFRAPKGTLSPEIRGKLTAGRREVISALRVAAAAAERICPLSFAQRSLWFLHQQAPESSAYNIAMPIRVQADLDMPALRQALQALTDRHAALRTTYDVVDGVLSQRVAGVAIPSFEAHHVFDMADDDLRRIIEADFRRPFDLVRGPVFRTSLYACGPSRYVLLLSVHHIAVDGWSLMLIIEELTKLYGEAIGHGAADLPRSDFQYADYVGWQEESLAGAEGERLWSYWRQKLAAPRAKIDLPTDRPRQALREFRGASVPIPISADTTERIKELARQECTTPFVVWLATFQAFLFRLTGIDDVIVGTPVFARSKAQFMRVVGDFVNAVPLRGHLDASMTFRELIAQMRGTVLEAIDAQEFPLPLLVERLQPEREPGRSPLFDIFFSLQRFRRYKEIEALLLGSIDDELVDFGGLRLGAYPIQQQVGQFDLALQLAEHTGGFRGALAYRTDLFDEATIERVVADYLTLVEAATAVPGAALEALSSSAAQPSSDPDDLTSLIGRLRERDIRLVIEGDRLRVNAPKGALDDEMRAAIAGRRDEIVAALKSGGFSEEKENRDKLPRVSRRDRLPVSSAQNRFWFLDRMEPNRALYNIGVVVRFGGTLDVEILRRAIAALVARHESLRTRLGEREGAPWLEIDGSPAPAIEVVDATQTPASSHHETILRHADVSLQRPFDLARGPLARFVVVALSARDHALIITVHHAVSDGWSLVIAIREICAFYESFAGGRAPKLPELTTQYVDYSAWENKQRQSGLWVRQLEYWKRQLQDAPAVLELPTDRPRPASPSFRGAGLIRYFDGRVIDALAARGREHGATLFMSLFAAWLVVLHRYCGQDDIVVGTPSANRDLPELEGLIGCLINTMALRGRLGGNPTFAELLVQVKQTTFAAFDHRDVPFDAVVETLNPGRDARHAPIFQVLFTLLSYSARFDAPSGLTAELVEHDVHASRFDLTVELGTMENGPRKGDFCAMYEYSTDLFDAPTIEQMHGHFERVITAVTADPSVRIDDLPLVSPQEEKLLLEIWNDTAAAHDRTCCVHQLFEAKALTSPNSPAVTAGEVTLSYRALDQKANRLAHLLRNRGIGPGSLVAICLERTVDIPIALAAVLKAGGAYVPLDPMFPAERLRYIIADAKISCAITLGRFAALFADGAQSLVLLDESERELAAQPSAPLDIAVRPEDLAYVIYTSGSTGQPKGVQVEHRNVVSFLAAMREEPGLAASDVLLAVTTLSFDIAGLEIWLPLSVGARIVIASRTDALNGERLMDLMETQAVSLLQATPATWRLLLDAGWSGKRDLKALCGGEALPRDLAAALCDRVGELWNVYGPTETTIWSTIVRVVDPASAITIGRPIANTRIYVLDPAGRLAPIGVAGEICIAGEGVARGYWNRQALTADKFATITLPGDRTERIYKTGDSARYRRDGQLEFLGRRDNQVKIRGYRIELGEIETALVSQTGVKECVVIVREDAPGDRRLAGYVTMMPGAEFEPESLRAALRTRLPEYMVPGLITVLQALPLTPNNKVDRKALPVPDEAIPRAANIVEPLMSPIERRVAGIWCEILRRDRVGLHNNFFDLGGHSLLLAKLHIALKQEFGADFAMVGLFQHTTVAAQANLLFSHPSGRDAPQPTYANGQVHV